jgi:hypothetical protein
MNAAVDGEVPGITILDSPNGHRYAVAETMTVHEAGAAPTIQSGVIELELRHEDVGSLPPSFSQTPVLTGELAEAVDLAQYNDDDTVIPVIVRLKRPEVLAQFVAVELEFARGSVIDEASLTDVRSILHADRAGLIADLQQEPQMTVEQLGGTLIYSCESTPCFVAEMSVKAIAELATHPDVVRISPVTESHAESLAVSVARGTQVEQFQEAGWLGQGGALSGRIPIAIIEDTFIHDDHAALRDFQNGPFRIIARYNCANAPNCPMVPDFGGGGNHAIGVTGIALGDITQNQHSAHQGVSTLNQRNRSGVAREAALQGFLATTSAQFVFAANRILGLSTDRPRVVNLSQGYGKWEFVGTSGFVSPFSYLTCSMPRRVRVNIAWFYEDNARDDLGGTSPGYDPVTGIGVEPE